MSLKLLIDQQGTIMFLDTPGAERELAALESLREQGKVRAIRASKVEMGEDGNWWVEIHANLKFGPFWPRSAALIFEHQWVEENILGIERKQDA